MLCHGIILCAKVFLYPGLVHNAWPCHGCLLSWLMLFVVAKLRQDSVVQLLGCVCYHGFGIGAKCQWQLMQQPLLRIFNNNQTSIAARKLVMHGICLAGCWWHLLDANCSNNGCFVPALGRCSGGIARRVASAAAVLIPCFCIYTFASFICDAVCTR